MTARVDEGFYEPHRIAGKEKRLSIFQGNHHLIVVSAHQLNVHEVAKPVASELFCLNGWIRVHSATAKLC